MLLLFIACYASNQVLEINKYKAPLNFSELSTYTW